MAESAAAIFAKIAIEKGFLDEKKVEQARTLQRVSRKHGKSVPIDKACLELNLLTPVQVKGLERGLKYYIVRKADKIYGKLAVKKKYADKDTVEHCLERQKSEFTKKKRLVRISKLLAGLDAIDAAKDAELRAEVAKRLTPEESHHEAEAASDPEGADAPVAPKGANGAKVGKKPAAAAKPPSGEKAAARAADAPASEESARGKKAFISGPRRPSGERAAAAPAPKDVEVRRSSGSSRAPAPAPAAEAKPISFSSEDDLEVEAKHDSSPVIPLPAPISGSETTEATAAATSPAPEAAAEVEAPAAAPAPAAPAPAAEEDIPAGAASADHDDGVAADDEEELILDDEEAELPAAAAGAEALPAFSEAAPEATAAPVAAVEDDSFGVDVGATVAPAAEPAAVAATEDDPEKAIRLWDGEEV